MIKGFSSGRENRLFDAFVEIEIRNSLAQVEYVMFEEPDDNQKEAKTSVTMDNWYEQDYHDFKPSKVFTHGSSVKLYLLHHWSFLIA